MSHVTAIFHGSCDPNEGGNPDARPGIGVCFEGNSKWNISAPAQYTLDRSTNNHAYIQAATWAIQQAYSHGATSITLKTNSQFTIDCMTKYIHKWKTNGWMTRNNEPVKNRKELEILDRVIRNTRVHVEWVKVDDADVEDAKILAQNGAHIKVHGDEDHPWQASGLPSDWKKEYYSDDEYME